ncbi:MAG: undecaprenyl-diphosphate phosphatase [Symbiobacteriaceae bacterium]|nr:undecaprenyl-diphosphate phosphatase [Symbiobacteriaceae bacterium]
MSWQQALVAGAIQGFTEFLPVSSSGHLVIYNTLLGEAGEVDLTFVVLLHLATLVALLFFYHRDVATLWHAFCAWVGDIFQGEYRIRTPERRFLLLAIIATIPPVVLGALFKLLGLTTYLENINLVAICLAITAVLVFTVHRSPEGIYTTGDAPFSSALFIGIMQGLAILPGISRSGSAIFGGLMGRFTKEAAVNLAFILSIPLVVGAGALELASAWHQGTQFVLALPQLVGFISALLSGMLAIRLVTWLARRQHFFIFGIYCILASLYAFAVGQGLVVW